MFLTKKQEVVTIAAIRKIHQDARLVVRHVAVLQNHQVHVPTVIIPVVILQNRQDAPVATVRVVVLQNQQDAEQHVPEEPVRQDVRVVIVVVLTDVMVPAKHHVKIHVVQAVAVLVIPVAWVIVV